MLDPTAGNGALLAPWPRDQRFGVEIDGDQVRAGDYHAITGDVQRAFPMLRKLGVQVPQIVANPPFGLTWTDGAGRPENSTVAVWRMSLALLAPQGVGAFICGRDRFRPRRRLGLSEARQCQRTPHRDLRRHRSLATRTHDPRQRATRLHARQAPYGIDDVSKSRQRLLVSSAPR